MYFKGTLLITDPCYFFFKDYPKESDFGLKNLEGLTNLQIRQYIHNMQDAYNAYDAAVGVFEDKLLETMRTYEFGKNMGVAGIKNYLMLRTNSFFSKVVVFNENTKSKAKSFNTYRANICVFLLEDVLAAFPDYDYYHIARETAVVIPHFDGYIVPHMSERINGFISDTSNPLVIAEAQDFYKPVSEFIDWNTAPLKYRYATMDLFGAVYLYTHTPSFNISDEVWDLFDSEDYYDKEVCRVLYDVFDCTHAIAASGLPYPPMSSRRLHNKRVN